MPDNTPATIATALCAATMAARDAYTVAIGVLPALAEIKATRASTKRHTDNDVFPNSMASSVSECQHVVLRAVLETRRSYLLALSLANQVIPGAISGVANGATHGEILALNSLGSQKPDKGSAKMDDDGPCVARPRVQLLDGTGTPSLEPHVRHLRLVRDSYGTATVGTTATTRRRRVSR